MKTIILPFVFSLLMITTKAQQPKCDTIRWSPTLRLNWTDYTGPIDSSISFKALTYSGFHFGWGLHNDALTVQTGANFFSCKSWVKPDGKSLLEHERLHFDITECYRRVLLQRVSQAMLTKSNCADRLNSIYSKVNTEWQEAEQKYDDETNHGVNKEKQASWEKYIHDKLQNLRAFSDEDLSLTIK